jgi:GTP cyclohydrolase I
MSEKPSEEEAAECVRKLLAYIGDDPNREGLIDTPRRVLGAIGEHFRGYHEDPEAHLSRTFSEVEGYDELVLVSDIEIYSHCEHHVVPFVGKAHVAYIPNGKVVGLSKIARTVDTFAKRLQVQEKLTAQIANAINETLTSRLTGCFLKDEAARMELLTLIGMPRSIGGAGG